MGLLFFKKSITIQFTYHKKERLKSRKLIDHLFSKGKSMSIFPVKMLYDFVETGTVPLQAGVAASSRNFKKAVDRNRVKRMLREAYRLQKNPLQDTLLLNEKSLVIFFIYTAKALPLHAEVHDKTGLLLGKLIATFLKQKTS